MHLLAFFAFSSFAEMFAFFYRDGGRCQAKTLIVLSALYCIRLHYTRLHSALVSAINSIASEDGVLRGSKLGKEKR